MAVRDVRRSRLDIQGEDRGVPPVVPIQGSYTSGTENSARVPVDGGLGVLHRVLHYNTLFNFVAYLPNSSTGGIFTNAHDFVINNANGPDGECPWFHNQSRPKINASFSIEGDVAIYHSWHGI